jgi:hypothetical protein
MDQQTRAGGTYVFAILLFMIAFIFFCFGIGLLFAFPDILALLGVVILAFSGVFIYSGIKNLNDAKMMDREANLQLRTASTTLQASTKDNNQTISDITILAHWQYSNEEWKRFMKWERRRRKTSSTIEAVLLIVLGSLVLRSLRDASWTEAIGISGAFAVIYWIGKYYISMNSIGKNRSNEVILTSRSVIINGKVNSFSDGLYWLEKIELIEEKDISVIEFVYAWNTRKGPSTEEIRIPIPNNKLAEAKEIIKLY